MNSNKKAAERVARQEEGQEAVTASGEINPCWVRFFEIIEELHIEIDRRNAAEKAAQEAGEKPGGSAHA